MTVGKPETSVCNTVARVVRTFYLPRLHALGIDVFGNYRFQLCYTVGRDFVQIADAYPQSFQETYLLLRLTLVRLAQILALHVTGRGHQRIAVCVGNV